LEVKAIQPAFRAEYEVGRSEGKRFADWMATAWSDDPEPLGNPRPPAFPLDLLPPWLREYVSLVSDATATPADLAAMISLGMLSSVLAGRIKVKFKSGFEHLNSYTAVALESGTRKSSVLKLMDFPIRELQDKERQDSGPKLAKLKSNRTTLEAALRDAEKMAARAALKNGNEFAHLQQQAEELAVRLEKLPKPVKPLRFVADCTPEALGVLLHQHGEVMAVISSEGGLVVNILNGRYSDSPNIELLCAAYTGDSYPIHRIGREEIVLSEPVLSLCVAVQPSVIEREMIGNRHFDERGLLGRFWFSLPTSKMGHRPFATPDIDADDERKTLYGVNVKALTAYPHPILTLSPGADEQLHILFALIEPKLDPVVGELRHMAAWCNRAPASAVRLSGLLHCANEEGDEIQEATMKRARQLTTNYLLPHAKRAFAHAAADPRTEAARELLQYILAKNWQVFRGTRLHQGVRGQKRFKRRTAVDEGLETLERARWVKRIPWEKDEWHLHPRAEDFKDE